jgi:hypothetical protein
LNATNRVIREFCAVSSSAHCIRSTSLGGTGAVRRPRKRMRTPSACSSGVSPSIRRPNILIKADTSALERRQFSVENEYTVSSRIPSSTASRRRALTVSAPASWPETTGSPRCLAQRPFPSVMIAT